MAAIGPAGERGVRYAAIANDGRLAGRTGAGAVMGSEAPQSDCRAREPPATGGRPARWRAWRGIWPTQHRSGNGQIPRDRHGRQRRLLQSHGDAAHAAISGWPLCRGGGDFRRDAAVWSTTPASTPAPPAPSAASITTARGTAVRRPTARLEYETLFALGSLCGVSDPNVVLRAAALCDDLGMDAISAGGTVAWAMECRAARCRSRRPRGGGSALGATARRCCARSRQIGAREGIGDLLAEGSRAAAERVGQGSEVWAMHVKGLELPGYDPRQLPTLALGLAVAARGACHNRSSAYEADLSDRLDRRGRRPAREPRPRRPRRTRRRCSTR